MIEPGWANWTLKIEVYYGAARLCALKLTSGAITGQRHTAVYKTNTCRLIVVLARGPALALHHTIFPPVDEASSSIDSVVQEKAAPSTINDNGAPKDVGTTIADHGRKTKARWDKGKRALKTVSEKDGEGEVMKVKKNKKKKMKF